MEVRAIQESDTLKPGVLTSRAWASMFGSNAQLQGIFSGPNLIAYFLLYTFQKMGKRVLIAAPFSPHCGFQLTPSSPKTFSITTDTKRALRSAANFLNSKYPNAYIDIALPPEVKDVQPFKEAGFDVDVAYTYRLDLTPEEGELLTGFSSERRKNIKDAEKKGFSIQLDCESKAVVARVRETLDKSGLRFDYKTLERILDSDLSFSVVSMQDEQVLAAAVIVYDDTVAYYIAGGADKSKGSGGAAAQVLWEAIKESKKRGIRQFDFCGSSVPSIEKFFRGFGGELTPYFRIQKNTFLFDLLKKAKSKLTG
jgi:hypothetical protein